MSREFRASPGRGSSRVLLRFAPTRASRAAARTRTSEAHSCRVPLLAHRTMTNYELAPPIYPVNVSTASHCSFPHLYARTLPLSSYLPLFHSLRPSFPHPSTASASRVGTRRNRSDARDSSCLEHGPVTATSLQGRIWESRHVFFLFLPHFSIFHHSELDNSYYDNFFAILNKFVLKEDDGNIL